MDNKPVQIQSDVVKVVRVNMTEELKMEPGPLVPEWAKEALPPAPAQTRPTDLPSVTRKLVRGDRPALYVTMTFDNGKPREVFINSADAQVTHNAMPLTRAISTGLKHGVPLEAFAEQLRTSYDPDGGYWSGQKYWPSYYVALGHALSEMTDSVVAVVNTLDLESKPEAEALRDAKKETELVKQPVKSKPKPCPKCGGFVVMSEGCVTCTECSWSKCG